MIGKSHGTSNVLFRIVAFRIPRNYTDNSISFHKIPIFRCIFESHFRVFRMKFAHLFICTENKTLNIGGILFRVTMQPLMKFPMKFPCDERNFFLNSVDSNQIRLAICRKSVITIKIWFDFTRFRKDFSACM